MKTRAIYKRKKEITNTGFRQFRKIITLLFFLSIGLQIAQAQFVAGDVIAIKSYNTSNYLTATNEGMGSTIVVTNEPSPTLYSLWRVYAVSGSTTYFVFENLGRPGYFLQYQNSGNTRLRLQSTTTATNNNNTTYHFSAVTSIFYNNAYYPIEDGTYALRSFSNTNYYIDFNGTSWRANSDRSTSANRVRKQLVFEKYTYTPGDITMTVNPPSWDFTTTGGSQDFTVNVSSGDSYVSGSNTIPAGSFTGTVEYSVTNPAFVISNTSNTGVRITTSATSNRQTGTLIATAKLNGETVAAVRVPLTLAASFLHKQGASGRAMIDNGKGIQMQGVHEQREVIYLNAGQSRNLLLPQQGGNYMNGYVRWYNYDTDAAVAFGLSNSRTDYTEASFGDYKAQTSGDLIPGTTSYTMPATAAPITIACDVSQYGDWTNTGGVFTEPTLSYRMIYEIRPASEMAAELTPCTGNTFYEERTIIAPVGGNANINIGPKYKYNGSNSSYYYYDNRNRLTQITSGTWYRNGVSITPAVSNDRTISVTGTAGQTVVYTLVGGGKNIVKLTVTFKAVANSGNNLGIGPAAETNGTAIINNTTLKEKYTLLASRDFDYQDGGTANLYPNPLPWQELGYGFTYTGSGAPTKLRTSGFADQSEYALIRTTYGTGGTGWLHDDVENKSGADKGYFVYIDAGTLPGIVADLSIDGDLCAGSTLAFSAWINNANKQGYTSPNLNFVLTGIKEGNVKELEYFTTGDIETSGTWHQVFYEFTLSEEKYEEYRLQIYNNGANSSGNDFGIDEIRIYTKKIPNRSMQAMVDCSTEDGVHTAILAIDYMSPDYKEIVWKAGVTDATFFYQWQEANGDVVNINNYLNMIGLSDGYGKITLKKWAQGDAVQGTVYNTLAEFFAIEGTPDETTFFYIMESLKDADGNDEIRPVLYIIQRSAMFTEGNTYYSAVAESATGLREFNCNTRSSFTVRQAVNVIIEDGGLGLNTNTLCAGDKYTVRTQLFASDVDGNVVEGYCLSDWYTGKELTQDEIDKINAYLKLFRGANSGTETNPVLPYKNATSFDQNTVGTYTTEVKAYLMSYEDNFSLATKDVEITVPEAGQPVVYYIFPIKETAAPLSTSDTGDFVFCTDPPVRAEFKGTALANYGDVDFVDVPAEIANKITNVRVAESTVTSINIPVYDSNVAEGGEVNGAITEFILYESTDPAYTGSQVYEFDVTGDLIPSNALTLTPKTGNTLELKAGYSYSFYGNIETNEKFDDCSVRATYFNLLVVPDVVVWSPQGDNSAWNNDNNWKTEDGRSGYVPLETSDVILRSQDGSGKDIVTWPILPTTSTTKGDEDYHLLGSGATNYITYDVNYKKNGCRNIYFEPGAKLINQQALTYDKAFVDMKVELYRWVMLAPPLKDMYSGDFFIPKNGYKTEEGLDGGGNIFYTQSTPPDHRRNQYPNWQSVYGKSSLNIRYDAMQGRPISAGSDGWLEIATNFLAEPYTPGTGLAIWAEDRVQTVPWQEKTPTTFRFPKTQTEYYYYNDSDVIMTGKVEPSKTEPFRFAFDSTTDESSTMKVTITNSEEGSVFLVGNPFMADLSLSAFLEKNTHLSGTVRIFANEGEEYEGVAPPTGDPTVILDTDTRTSSEIYTLSEGNQDLKTWIAPMRSFLVELAEGTATTVEVEFSSDMADFVYDVPTSQPQNVSGLRSAGLVENENAFEQKRDRLTVSVDWEGSNAKTMIAFNDKTSMHYNSREDALLYFDIDQSIALYSIADDKALSINLIPKENKIMVPLGLMSNKGENQTLSALWTFSGIDGMDYELYIVDSQTNESILLQEGMQLNLETPTNSSKYFIRGEKQNVIDPNPPVEMGDLDKQLTIYQDGEGRALIYSTERIQGYTCYTLSGQLVKREGDLNQYVCTLSPLSTGIYIVTVLTDTSSITQKVVIK